MQDTGPRADRVTGAATPFKKSLHRVRIRSTGRDEVLAVLCTLSVCGLSAWLPVVGNSFVCGIESLNDERVAAAGHYSE
jgi:hypothetical protein